MPKPTPPANDNRPSTTTQTVRIAGKRVRLVTRDGVVTTKPAGEEEWVLQAEIVRQLRALPEFVDDAAHVRPGTFTLAGDFNAARRSMREAAKAKATGLTPGEHDVRLYLDGGRLALIEVKAERTPVSRVQKDRHALLAALGFTRQTIIRATTPDDAAAQAVELMRGWLAAGQQRLDKSAA
jgi:hypothetical protein